MKPTKTALNTNSVFALIIAVGLLVSACGGSSGDAPSLSPQPGSPGNLNDPIVRDPTPDFAILNFVTSNEVNNNVSRVFNASVTITNNGDGPGNVSSGWFLLSIDPDFINDYRYMPVRLRAQNPVDGPTLAPSESRTFVLTTDIVGNFIDLGLGRSGTHYAKFWINPNLSARFINPENNVAPSYADVEKNYDNNLSELTAFNSIRRFSENDCVPDIYENNDSLDEATAITLNTRYEFNGCDESLDVMSVDLIAGASYELFQDPADNLDRWNLSVVDPLGNYLVRDVKENNIITATITGTHHITTSFSLSPFGNNLAYISNVSFEVRQR